MSDHYQIAEIFHSVQGEGVLAGGLCTFIRLQGCPVGCEWCDTKYTWGQGGTRMTVWEIYQQVKYAHVVITGGEPTLYNLDDLMDGVAGLAADNELPGAYKGYVAFQLETSGLSGLKGRKRPDWITCSPKEKLGFEIAPDLYPLINEFKFVVDESLPEEVVEGVQAKAWGRVPFTDDIGRPRSRPHHDFYMGSMFIYARRRPKIVLMPEGCPPRQEMIERSLEWITRHPTWRISDRMQYRFDVP